MYRIAILSFHGCPVARLGEKDTGGMNVYVRQMARELGHRGHQEVKGSMGQVPMLLVDDRESRDLPDWESDTPIAILTQTTLSVDDTQSIIKAIKTKTHQVGFIQLITIMQSGLKLATSLNTPQFIRPTNDLR